MPGLGTGNYPYIIPHTAGPSRHPFHTLSTVYPFKCERTQCYSELEITLPKIIQSDLLTDEKNDLFKVSELINGRNKIEFRSPKIHYLWVGEFWTGEWDTVVLVKTFIQQMYWAFNRFYFKCWGFRAGGHGRDKDLYSYGAFFLKTEALGLTVLKELPVPWVEAIGSHMGGNSIFSRFRCYSEGWFTAAAEGSDGNLRSALLRLCAAKAGRGRLQGAGAPSSSLGNTTGLSTLSAFLQDREAGLGCKAILRERIAGRWKSFQGSLARCLLPRLGEGPCLPDLGIYAANCSLMLPC